MLEYGRLSRLNVVGTLLSNAIGYLTRLRSIISTKMGVRNTRAAFSNNIAERALRAVALGRKNYLFSGADCGNLTYKRTQAAA
jgi:hypothetical protein